MATDSALKRLAQMSVPGNWLIASIEGAQVTIGTGRTDPGWFHPSALGNNCDAHLAFRFLGAPARVTIEAKLQRIFDYGHEREGYLQEWTKHISLVKSKEDRKIEIPHLRIRGELDNWVFNPVTKEQYIIDYKTMRSGQWKETKEVLRSHRLQLHPYQFARQTYKGYVLYENKDTQELKAMPSDFDGQVWKREISDRIERILSGLENNVVDRNPANCNSCPFYYNGVCGANQIKKLKEDSGLYF